MGQVILLSCLAVAMAVLVGLLTFGPIRSETAQVKQYRTAYVEPAIGEPALLTVGSAGSALATAAFGMSALQPETYNGEIVLNIIEASPLAAAEKMQLFANLQAVEDGQANLRRVLADVRVALAIE